MPFFTYPPTNTRQSIGKLIVQLSTDPQVGNVEPIENVQITIRGTAPTGEENVIAEVVTNEVGQTPTIEVPVPPLDYSLDPTNTQIPYATYRIETSANNYIDTLIRGSQVFADTLSIQPIALQPIQRWQRDTSHHPNGEFMRQLTDNVTIGPATLYGNYPPKIPEAEIKPIIPGSGFITLTSVIVPEYIIVHAGSPNDSSAPNYTIPFLDYIANVASSEIYPTWPTETIKANVIAIVSFTLNRVFTEWYRNQGKSYTITNSTAYDHAFFYGRNLFDTIVPVVNDVFDIYVQRPGVLQPLLTQYCDGVKSQCPNWMTQWGSKDLGDAGFTAEQILRNFYGNINLSTAPAVEGNPESYPGSPLQIGSSGPAVRQLQEQLNRISQNYPLIPKVAVNGVFDDATANAVRTFQQIFHLTQDGIVGKSTWYEISRIYVAVSKLAELG